MSNSLAIATVTATLRQVLQTAVVETVSGANVSPVRPDAFKNGSNASGVSVFLYQVTPNPSWRNADLPTRRGDGSVLQRPQAALDLHYLLTFFGDELKFEPQRMLGSVVSALHSRPVLTRANIRGAIRNEPILDASDLAEQVELVKLTPHPLNLEELARLWSVFFQTPYALSILYQATVVLIEAKEETPSPAPPVRFRSIVTIPAGIPSIEQVTPQIVEYSNGVRITLKGRNLAGPSVVVRFGDSESAPQRPESDTELVVALPVGLSAGVRTARVVHGIDLGTTIEPHKVFESNAVAFILQPVIRNVSYRGGAATAFNVDVMPDVTPRQQATLILRDSGVAAPLTYSFDAAARQGVVSSLSFPITGASAGAFPAGTYHARVRVDNAESSMDAMVTVP